MGFEGSIWDFVDLFAHGGSVHGQFHYSCPDNGSHAVLSFALSPAVQLQWY